MSVVNRDKDLCCGCSACQNICPVHAIEMVADEEGFLYPHIDSRLCRDCGLCKKTCPMLSYENRTSKKDLDYPYLYAVKNKNYKILKESSSGGFFYAASHFIIGQNGVVCGVLYNGNFEVYHSCAETEEQICAFSGSKYVQSNMTTVFVEIQKHLDVNRKVLFSGTPCQVQALKAFLKKDYDNLFLCDIICHGVPSPLIFREYLEYIEKKSHNKIRRINMRDKTLGMQNQKIRILFDNGKSWFNCPETKLWHVLFGGGNMLRPSCYKCPFTNIHRVGDITMGDFLGIETLHLSFPFYNGTSLCFINNSKGEALFDAIKSQFIYVPTSIEKGMKFQQQLLHPVKKSAIRENFWLDYKNYGFLYIAGKYGNLNLKKRIRGRISNIKGYLKWLKDNIKIHVFIHKSRY